jgi:hypothetical protein
LLFSWERTLPKIQTFGGVMARPHTGF